MRMSGSHFLTALTVRSVGSMANFIPSGASGTESMAELANSEKVLGIRPFFSMYIRSCTVNLAWMAPLSRSWTGRSICCAATGRAGAAGGELAAAVVG